MSIEKVIGDLGLSKVQDIFEGALDSTNSRLDGLNGLEDGKLVENLSASTGASMRVVHNLGRAAKGWIIVDQNAHARFKRITGGDPKKELVLVPDNNVTKVSVLVF